MGLHFSQASLTAAQVEELAKKLSTMRHDINNNLSMIVAAAELIKLNPASAARMADTLSEQPSKISQAIQVFSTDFEKQLGIARE
jgi:hypothetical protein